VSELQLQRGGVAGTALMMVDIDHFKVVLRAVARVLSSNIKGRDVAARYWGEEFAVLLPETSLSGAGPRTRAEWMSEHLGWSQQRNTSVQPFDAWTHRVWRQFLIADQRGSSLPNRSPQTDRPYGSQNLD